MQIPWRRAGATSSTIGRILLMTLVAAVLLAATALPVIGLTGIAVTDAANTFDTLQVGTLGAAPTRSVVFDSSRASPSRTSTRTTCTGCRSAYNQIAPVMRNAIVAIEDAPSASRARWTRAARCGPC